MNKVLYQPKAIKQLRKILAQKVIRNKINDLSNMLNCHHVKKLINHQYDYRLRVGNYRVLFNYDDVISIISIEEVKNRDERTY